MNWPDLPAPKEDAPNVIVILLDDAGFGMTSTFGGSIPTPNLDKLVDQGLRYNRFHTTAICGPSRAALITGRNHIKLGGYNFVQHGGITGTDWIKFPTDNFSVVFNQSWI